MRLKEYDVDPSDESLTGHASNVTGATWAITTTANPDGLAHQVSVRNDSATDHSAKTITLTGTDADGKEQTETMAAPGTSATVESTKYFKTLTTATVSASIGADTFDIGWVDEVVTKTIPLNWRNAVPATINVDVTGTINFTVQQTFDALQTAGYKAQQDAQWVDITALAAKTADTLGAASLGATAIRLLTTSYSSGAELQMNVNQPDY
jgi:hypothetical protein